MTLQYKQTQLFYTKVGSGPSLVLLHGFLESHTMWKPFLKKWAKTHTVITVDLLGHGKTGCLGYIHTMKQMAESVIAILEHEKIPTAIFIGHSMGGYVALEILAQQSNLISKLVLLNSTAEADSDERKKNRDRAVALLKSHPKAYVSMAITNLFATESLEAFRNDIEHLKETAISFSVQGLIAATEGMKVREDYTLLFQSATVPKAVIGGIEDPIISIKKLETLALKAHAKFYALEGGHMSTIENQEGVTKAINDFLSLPERNSTHAL